MKKIAEILYKKPFWLFLLFLFVAYLPVLLPFFHLKNDMLNQNLPTRFVFGESIYSGYEPFWNPYLHYGTPEYGDMNNGFWNPVQWLIGAITGYNVYTITFEELFYLLVGGWGIYKVSRELFNKDVALVTGLAYMCCGFLTGHFQYLCWITGTAYFPYVLLYFIRVNKDPVIKNFMLGAICVFLFTASSHPGLIIGAAYFFLFLLLAICFNRKNSFQQFYNKNFWKVNALFFLTSCLFSIVVIVSNIEVIQHISRGSKVSLDEALMAPTTFQSYLSTFLPLPVHKTNFFNTDIAMRNVYIGLAHLLGIFLFLKISTKRIFISWLIPLLFFILLGAGGYFKEFAWNYLPLTGFVRLNGEFTYFVLLLLLLAGGAGLQQFIIEKKKIILPQIASYLLWISIFVAAAGIAGILITHSSIIFSATPNSFSLKQLIKSLIDNSSFWDLLLLQASIQAVTIYFIKRSVGNKLAMNFWLCINLVVITWLTLPFTGLGMMPKKEVQAVINKFPRGIHTQELVSINNASYIQPADEKQFLLISCFSKKIGSPNPDQYPVQLNSNANFINDSSLYGFIKDQAFLFLSNDTVINTSTNFDPAHITVVRSGPGYTKCIIRNDSYKWLTLLQNNYSYWGVKIDGQKVTHQTSFKTFISVPIEKGEHTVVFEFKPTMIKIIAWANLFMLIIGLAVAIFPRSAKIRIFRSSSPS